MTKANIMQTIEDAKVFKVYTAGQIEMTEANIMQTIGASTVFEIYAAGQMDERAKIVAWLRKEAQVLIDQSELNESYCLAMLGAATDIEAEEHLE